MDEKPLTPAEALVKFFLDNADRGQNAANDELVEQFKQRIRPLTELPENP